MSLGAFGSGGRRTGAFVGAFLCFAVAGCGSNGPNANSPYAVDPPLREAASNFAVALSERDAKVLSELNGGKDDGLLAPLLASYGGLETHPFAYNSEYAGTAYVQFIVMCVGGSRILHEVFIYVSGKWRPDLASIPPVVEGPIPAAKSPAPLVPPTETPQPACR